MSDTTTCETKGCEREARMAIDTSRPSRDVLKSVLYFDNRSAPRKAARYCKTCGAALAQDLVNALTDADDD